MLEIENIFEESHGRFNKRPKYSSPFDQKWSMKSNEFSEPSPLGLKLRRTQSFLELIQKSLSQGNNASSLREMKVIEGKTSPTAKRKASNFPASLLRIGHWEYVSRYEGDLVAKCYFAKEKLVWEILDGGLKCKFEIHWSNIIALKANCPHNGPGTLTLVLARPPLFYRETNPQPRKHTSWQESTDFTNGEASLHRQHVLQCPEGMLNKHYEKLLRCDMRLKFLSQKPELVLESPYFEAWVFVSDGPDDPRSHGFNQLETPDMASPSTARSSSPKIEHRGSLGKASDQFSQALSPISVMDLRAIEWSGSYEKNCFGGLEYSDQLKTSTIQPSMSMSDQVNHVEHCIWEKVNSGNLSSEKALQGPNILEEIEKILLDDTESQTTASEEKYFLSRTNSFYRLLEDPIAGSNTQVDEVSSFEGKDIFVDSKSLQEDHAKGVFGFKQPLGMSREDSYGELLANLP